MSKVIQVSLANINNEVLTTWVDARPDLKKGVFITLKDFKPDMKWKVVEVYDGEHEKSNFDWHRKWTNNI